MPKKLSVKKIIGIIEGRRDEYLRISSLRRGTGQQQIAAEMLVRADECDCALMQILAYEKPVKKLTVPKGIKITTVGWADKKSRS